jgi:hypothetical protein
MEIVIGRSVETSATTQKAPMHRSYTLQPGETVFVPRPPAGDQDAVENATMPAS